MAPAMSFSPGTRVSSYEILSRLGKGGMGEVYRARDWKLGREVALKLLPQAFMTDVMRVARFHREAQVLASLNHPHIAQIHGLEEEQGACFLVLELVEGETLAERLRQGPLPLDDAVRIAQQIAEALEAAHEKGIVHRDLKPANIALTGKGQVKVLDFGLAKGRDDSVALSNLTNSPTLTSPLVLSGVGVIVGTAAYMSPEQARGRVVDHRADIWALGCVLYEMLTCVPPFKGESFADVLVSILTEEPDWQRLPSATPSVLRQVLEGALEKNVDHRIRELRALRAQLESVARVDSSASSKRRTEERSERWNSLAVLPFTFLNDVDDRQALSLGFADALITTLGNVDDLAVAPTSAILRYAPGAEPGRSRDTYKNWARNGGSRSRFSMRQPNGSRSPRSTISVWRMCSRCRMRSAAASRPRSRLDSRPLRPDRAIATVVIPRRTPSSWPVFAPATRTLPKPCGAPRITSIAP
jgi:serine/threonine protein kinase